MSAVHLVTLRPGHFHAALIQKEMLPGIDRCVHVYSPLDADLLAHLGRIAGFNARPETPTAWEMEVHTGRDWLYRFRRERRGNVAVLAGRNRTKIDLMTAAVEAGLHVLADKPWIIEPEQLPKLEALLVAAERAGLLVYDIMTERFEITSILQRELVNDPDIFGEIIPGTRDEPAVTMESVHYLKKLVAGAPSRRPAWFFDTAEQGEALADVGTHLVDLVMWVLFTPKPIDYRRDVQLISARRWPTRLKREHFEQITGLPDFPAELRDVLNDEALDYYCNTQVTYAVRGVHVKLDVLWDYEAPPGGGDTHNAVFRGSRSRVEVRQASGGKPELYVVPEAGANVGPALQNRVRAWQSAYTGVGLERAADAFHISIPDALRTGHEAHFAEVLGQFLRYLESPGALPAWERPHLLAKYFVTTHGVALSRAGGGIVGMAHPPRIEPGTMD
jgi:predicted dehydrogenase